MQMTDAAIWKAIETVPHWYHKIPIRPGIVTPGTCEAAETLKTLDLPADCRGLRVLDLGTRDGYFAFEMERRGATVVAVDYMPAEETGFRVTANLLGSRVEFRRDNIYNLTLAKYGRFDIVLFLGLLYHLPDPVLAIQLLRPICSDILCVESHVIDNCITLPDGSVSTLKQLSPQLADIPLMQFYRGQALNADPTNYWGPNMKCLEAMLEECTFQVLCQSLVSSRGIFKCRIVHDEVLNYQNRIARGLPGE